MATTKKSLVAVAPLDGGRFASPPLALVASSRSNSRRQRKPRASRLVPELCGVGVPTPRFTITKFREYDVYCTRTSAWRRVAVIVFTPLPAILTALIPPLIPLQDPMLGVLQNTGFMLHFFVTLTLVMFGSVFQVHAPLRLTLKEMPIWRALLIAVIGSAHLTALVTLVGYIWRFPIPFVWMTAYTPYLILLAWAHVLVLGRTLRSNPTLCQHFVTFIPSYIAQGSQVVVYPAFSALFEVSGNHIQVFLSLCFPVIKHVFRRLVFLVTHHLPNDAEVEAVSSVEICSVMYQTLIMQSAPSPITTAIIMGIDVVQGLFSVYVLMKTPSSIPQRHVLARARHILCVERPTISDKELSKFGTLAFAPLLEAQRRSLSSMNAVSRRLSSFQSMRKAPFGGSKVALVASTEGVAGVAVRPLIAMRTARDDNEVMTHALEAIQAAESIVLIEYFEVAIPIANVVYIAWASSFHSAIYNPKIRPYYEAPDQLHLAIQSLALYTVLQATSLVFLQAILWHRYRVSAMTLLAFVLERHTWSMQGKLITWLTLNFQFPGMHYGTDFTFKFDFRSPACAKPPCG